VEFAKDEMARVNDNRHTEKEALRLWETVCGGKGVKPQGPIKEIEENRNGGGPEGCTGNVEARQRKVGPSRGFLQQPKAMDLNKKNPTKRSRRSWD